MQFLLVLARIHSTQLFGIIFAKRISCTHLPQSVEPIAWYTITAVRTIQRHLSSLTRSGRLSPALADAESRINLYLDHSASSIDFLRSPESSRASSFPLWVIWAELCPVRTSRLRLITYVQWTARATPRWSRLRPDPD